MMTLDVSYCNADELDPHTALDESRTRRSCEVDDADRNDLTPGPASLPFAGILLGLLAALAAKGLNGAPHIARLTPDVGSTIYALLWRGEVWNYVTDDNGFVVLPELPEAG